MTTFEIIQLIIGSGVGLSIIRISFILGKLSQKFDSFSDEQKNVRAELSSINKELSHINGRLCRLEGSFYERGNWESRKTGTEESKKNG